MITPRRPPNLTNLRDHQKPVVVSLMETFEKNRFRKEHLNPLVPRLVDELAAVCSTLDDMTAVHAELENWVRWWRVPALWMTYVLQATTLRLKSPFHAYACILYSDAQTHFANDLAMDSLEKAYNFCVRNREQAGDVFDRLAASVRSRLQLHHRYCYQWAQPFDHIDCNPCSEHLYGELSRFWLASDVAEDDVDFDARDGQALARLIDRCDKPELGWHQVVARRNLGLRLAVQRDYEASAEQFRIGLDAALGLRLETEIGHLRRHYGYALRVLDRGDEARHQFEQAYAFETQDAVIGDTSYWVALSARELGDVLSRFAGRPAAVQPESHQNRAVEFDDPEVLRPALRAYRSGRFFLDGHMMESCPYPAGRAAKQQMFRSFSDNAIRVACLLQSPVDMLAEVEWAGPREATELVTEIAAARVTDENDLAEFRRHRAIYQTNLNTLPRAFEDYLKSVPEISEAKHNYLVKSLQLDKHLYSMQQTDAIVKQILDLRIANTVFLLFHVGLETSFAIIVDMESGTAAPFHADFGERHLRHIQKDYEDDAVGAGGKRRALITLLERYEELLVPILEPVARFLPGRHLKIFPRLQMNAVPLHAIRIGDRYLIECAETVSYGQTLGLFLENHRDRHVPNGPDVHVVLGDDVPWYEFMMNGARGSLGSSLVESDRPTWASLLESLSTQPARDLLFACHGSYDPRDLAHSHLDLGSAGADGKIQFSTVFESLDLRGCRNVIMGACESGLIHSRISAEYIGLASAMLSSGARYVTGALWTIPQTATAVLVERYLTLTQDHNMGPCEALCRSQREVFAMSREAFHSWVQDHVPAGRVLDQLSRDIDSMPEIPFSHPYYWAGLQTVGDI